MAAPNFLDPPSLRQGDMTTGVFEVVQTLDSGDALGVRCADRTEVLFLGGRLELGRISVYGCLVIDEGCPVRLGVGSSTKIFQIPDVCPGDLMHSIELFAGFGGMGIAAEALGVHTAVAIDWCPLAEKQLKCLGRDKILLKDIRDQDTAFQVHSLLERQRPLAFMGFPCQPHSTQGSKLGFKDSRSLLFYDGMNVIYQIQCSAAILECVVGAGEQDEILQTLRRIAELMHWSVHMVKLDLGVQWPNKRHRWWAMLLPKKYDTTGLSSWPASSPYRVVNDIMVNWGKWTESEMKELMLSIEEINAYGDTRLRNERRELQLDSQVPTILHSYSNVLGPCPCGCRSKGIGIEKLVDKGLRGRYVVEFPGAPPRYLHPKEAGLLLGVHPNTPMEGSLRERLCLLGLVASPIQGVWLVASLLENVQTQIGKRNPVKPLDELRKYQAHLLDDDHWQFQPPTTFICLSDDDGPDVRFLAPDFAIIDEVQAAERINIQWGQCCKTLQVYDANSMPNEVKVHIQKKMKIQRTQPPRGPITVAVKWQDEVHVVQAELGDFVFQVLWQLGVTTSSSMTAKGRHVYPDERIWETTIIEIADCASPFTLKDKTTAAGNDESEELTLFVANGLSDVQIFNEAKYLFYQSGVDFNLFWSPKLIVRIQDAWSTLANTLIREKKANNEEGYGIMWDEGHWVLFHFRWQDDNPTCDFWDGMRSEPSDDMFTFAHQLAFACDCAAPQITMKKLIRQSYGAHCGTIALLHLRHLLLEDEDLDEIDAILWFHDMKKQQEKVTGIVDSGTISETLTWSMTGAGNADYVQPLAKLLQERGVPAAAAEDRAREVASKIGVAMVNHALRASNPWQALKTAANTPSTRMRLITQAEQQEYINSKAKDKFGISTKNSKKNKSKIDTNRLTLDPQLLQVQAGHFQDSDGADVQSIAFEDVGAGQSGAALATSEQAKSFISNPRVISPKALCILLVDLPPDEVATPAGIERIRFPAQYRGTDEQIVVFGGILQLGDKKVQRKRSGPNPKPDLVKTAVVKIMVYKDQFDYNWDQFARSPVKCLLQTLPQLTLCDGDSCGHDCGKTHAPIGEQLESIIFEVWGRTFLMNKGSKTSPEKADLFVVFVRVPELVIKSIINTSQPGVYMEPRQDGQRGHHDDYRVVWLPKSSYQQAMHVRRTSCFALNLVRNRERYGIQVHKKDEASTWKEVRPDEDFEDVRILEVFELAPIPHGTTRQTMKDLLSQWGWKSKPLQPGRGSMHHMSWRIGSDTSLPKMYFRASIRTFW